MSSGSEKRVRTSLLIVRLTPEERTSIDASAERAGLATGSYVRQTLLGVPAPRAVRRLMPDSRLLAQLLGQLGKIGSNLNQLAKSSNQGLMIYQNEILVALGGLKVIRDALMDALGHRP